MVAGPSIRGHTLSLLSWEHHHPCLLYPLHLLPTAPEGQITPNLPNDWTQPVMRARAGMREGWSNEAQCEGMEWDDRGYSSCWNLHIDATTHIIQKKKKITACVVGRWFLLTFFKAFFALLLTEIIWKITTFHWCCAVILPTIPARN